MSKSIQEMSWEELTKYIIRKYADSERAVIYECSGDFDYDFKELALDVIDWCTRIDELKGEQQ